MFFNTILHSANYRFPCMSDVMYENPIIFWIIFFWQHFFIDLTIVMLLLLCTFCFVLVPTLVLLWDPFRHFPIFKRSDLGLQIDLDKAWTSSSFFKCQQQRNVVIQKTWCMHFHEKLTTNSFVKVKSMFQHAVRKITTYLSSRT